MNTNKTHMCVNNLAYVEYGTQLHTRITSLKNFHMRIISISAIMIFYNAEKLPLKELFHERS